MPWRAEPAGRARRPAPGNASSPQPAAEVRAGGVEGASSWAITTAAGVNLAAITYHFGGKDALVAAALAAEVRAWAQPVIDALDVPGDPAAAMLGAIAQLNDTFDTARDLTPALLDAVAHAIRHRTPEVLAMWEQLRTRLARRVGELRQTRTRSRRGWNPTRWRRSSCRSPRV